MRTASSGGVIAKVDCLDDIDAECDLLALEVAELIHRAAAAEDGAQSRRYILRARDLIREATAADRAGS